MQPPKVSLSLIKLFARRWAWGWCLLEWVVIPGRAKSLEQGPQVSMATLRAAATRQPLPRYCHTDQVSGDTNPILIKSTNEGGTHRVEWPDIITYSWAPKRQNLNVKVVWMAKNKREKALICLQGVDKTGFPDFRKSQLIFWTAGFSWGMLYLQL